jgi:hypothetical protein
MIASGVPDTVAFKQFRDAVERASGRIAARSTVHHVSTLFTDCRRPRDVSPPVTSTSSIVLAE